MSTLQLLVSKPIGGFAAFFISFAATCLLLVTTNALG